MGLDLDGPDRVDLPLQLVQDLPLQVGRPLALASLLACSVASPATEVRDALARAAPLELPAGAARVVLARATFADVTVSLEGGRARVVAVVDADGPGHRWTAREVRVGYVGREAFEMERCARARWCPAGAPLPALAGGRRGARGGAAPRRPAARSRGRSGWSATARASGEDAVRRDGARAPRGALELVRDGVRWRLSRAARP